MQRIKLHGAFRSGTNYLKALLELNHDVELVGSNGGWKHAPVPATFMHDRGWPIVGVVRNPWHWLVSLWSYAQADGSTHIDVAGSWRRFLVSPMTIGYRLAESNPAFRFASPPDYWNAMVVSLFSVGDRAHVVRYEDAVAEPQATCAKIAVGLDLERRAGPFRAVDLRTRNMTDRRRTRLEEYTTEVAFDRATALSAVAAERFTRSEARDVRRRLDAALLARLDYLQPGLARPRRPRRSTVTR